MIDQIQDQLENHALTATAQQMSPEMSDPLTLTVARDDGMFEEHLMILFAKWGSISERDVLSYESPTELIRKSEEQGLKISEPVLVAVTNPTTGIARRTFITPVPKHSFRDFSVWVGSTTEKIEQLQAKKLAFYFCKDALPAGPLFELLTLMVRSVSQLPFVKDIALVVGSHSYNELIGICLELKQELDQSKVGVQILH